MSDQIENYGYVPFFAFQYVMIGLVFYSIYKKDYIRELLDENIYQKVKDTYLKKIVMGTVAMLPVLIMFYYDAVYSSFSMNNLGVTKIISNKYLNMILRLFGSYTIIQVAAQDLGIKTGDNQSAFTKLLPVQFFLYFGGAFAITQNRSESLFAAMSYFLLRYFASEKTLDVCFE